MKCRFKEIYEVIPLSINETYTAATEGWKGEEVFFSDIDKEAAKRKSICGFIVKMNNKQVFYNCTDFKYYFEIIEEE